MFNLSSALIKSRASLANFAGMLEEKTFYAFILQTTELLMMNEEMNF
jgi:hypothetical protein